MTGRSSTAGGAVRDRPTGAPGSRPRCHPRATVAQNDADDAPDARAMPDPTDPRRLAALASYAILDTPPEAGFDDIVHLARRACRAPAALVSLVAGDRQWFKARAGFEPGQTPIDRSICRHALDGPGLLVIPDLTQDPRTEGNPLVTGAPHLRFYAGARLETPGGEALGTLCVLDHAPRPGGLGPAEAEDLRALARQVMAQLELRRALAERDRVIAERDRARGRSEAVAATLAAVAEAGPASGGDLPAILDTLVAGAMRAVPQAEGGGIEMREGGELVYRSGRGSLAPHVGLRLPLAGSLSGAALTTGEPILCPDVAADPRVKRDLVAVLGMRSALYVPVHRGGEAVGVLKLQSSRVGAFAPEDLDAAVLIAGTVASGLAEAGEAEARAAVRASEIRYRSLFEAIDAGFCIFEMRFEGDRAVDYRFIETNPAFRAQTGLSDAEGRWMRELAPGHEQSWFDLYGRVARTGEPVHVEQRSEALGRDFEVRAFRAGLPGQDRVAALFTDTTARRHAERALQRSEAHWRGLFEQLREGFVLGRVVRDAGGRVVDWRYEEVNRAWGDLVGIPSGTATGRTVRELFPGIEDAWVDEFAGVVETGRSATFVRQVGILQRWYEGRAHRLTDETFAVLFLEVTERVLADATIRADEQRTAALLELGDRLRALSTVPEMTRAAAEIVGRTLEATRAGLGRLDGAGETVTIDADWTAPGVGSIAGRHRFADFGDLRRELLRGEPLVIDDVAADPRTAADPSPLRAIGVGALVNMPLREHGRTVAVFLVHADRARTWSPEELAFLRTVADRVGAGVGRVRAEERQRLLNDELSHRLKNTLALVQSIAAQTLRNAPDIDAARDGLAARLVALGRAHDILLAGPGGAARVPAVVAGALALHEDSTGRFSVAGPDLLIGPSAALSLSLLLHELATNAAKYGALSTPEGRVAVAWSLAPFDGAGASAPHDVALHDVTLTWRESGGPPVVPPSRKGFGSRLIERGLAGAVGGRVALDYRPEGVTCTLSAPLAGLQAGL
jgi:PAS domain S-box-containing protein